MSNTVSKHECRSHRPIAWLLVLWWAISYALTGQSQTLSAGYQSVTATIDTGNTAGGPDYVGHGRMLPLQHAPHLAGEHTTLVWEAADREQPVIRLRGREKTLSDFSILGDCWNKATRKYDLHSTEKPPVGILEDWDPGLGTGKHTIKRLTLQGFQTGIQAGRTAEQNNCDETKVEQVFFYNCDTGFLFKHKQAMGWYVDAVEFVADSPDDALFYYQAGGDLRAENTFVPFACRLLVLEGIAGGIGPNNAIYRFDGVKVDSQAGNKFVAVDMPDTDEDKFLSPKVTIDGLALPIGTVSYGDTGDYLALIAGGTRVTFEQCVFERPLHKSLRWRQEDARFQPSFVFKDCLFRGLTSGSQLMDPEHSLGKCKIIFEDNYNERGQVLPRYSYTRTGESSL